MQLFMLWSPNFEEALNERHKQNFIRIIYISLRGFIKVRLGEMITIFSLPKIYPLSTPLLYLASLKTTSAV